MSPRVREMLESPIVPTLAKLAWPNLLMMLAQSATGLVEAWFVARLGTASLAGISLVVPVIMLMGNMSQGAMGGGISSAVARALGARDDRKANELVLNGVFINVLLGAIFTVLMLVFSRPLYRALGGTGEALDAAVLYSNVVFAGIVLMWTMNAFASVIRGTGNMLMPGVVICGGALLLVPLSPCLIFGVGPFPKMGIAGAGASLLVYYGVGAIVLGWYCASGRNVARLSRGRLRWSLIKDILTVGGFAVINPLLTNALIALTTAIVGTYAGMTAVAGYGTGVRLEYLVIPISFGIGAPMVALVASNMGAGQRQRAVRIALTGGALAFVLCETLGVLAALFPIAWLRMFGADEHMLEVGSAYLRIVGPVYGFFGLGFSLYFASQGARRLMWPLLAGLARLLLAVGGGWLVLRSTGSLSWFFAASALGMVAYGLTVVSSIGIGGWTTRPSAAPGILKATST